MTIEELLIYHEGKIDHAYQDSLGFWTIGVGHLIDKRKGGRVSDAIIKALLDEDIQGKIADLDERLPWWKTLDEVRQKVLIDMCFNLGIGGLLGFKNTLQAIKEGRWTDAKNGMLSSVWAKQVGTRANELAKMIETGEDL